jgi:2-dehydro-3-deoxygluconokinase
MYDILGIGEALIEFAEVEPALYEQAFAGDMVNTLYYASRLGLTTSFISMFGKDLYTKSLLNFLDESGIDRSSCLVSTEKNNGLYIIRNDENGEPEFTFFRENSSARDTLLHYDEKKLLNRLDESKCVVFSGIVLAVFHDVEQLIKLLGKRRSGVIVYFDVNVRTSLWKDISILRDWIRRLAGLVDIISLSVSDDEKIFGKRPKQEIMDWYRDKGYSKIILRDGEGDVLLYFDAEYSIAPQKVEQVIDATGAGDAFNAAFIAAYLKNKPPTECAEAGNNAAAQVLGYHGGIVKEFDPLMLTAQ